MIILHSSLITSIAAPQLPVSWARRAPGFSTYAEAPGTVDHPQAGFQGTMILSYICQHNTVQF
eukprot:8359867-Karenia_brevis.AAC.1